MYYFSQQTIINAIEALKDIIPSKFIGLLSILRSIKTDGLKTNETYEIKDSYIGNWLNDTMMLEDFSSVMSESTLYVRFANGWSDYVSETMFSTSPKLYALIIFIASLFHFSALLFFILLPLSRKRLSKKQKRQKLLRHSLTCRLRLSSLSSLSRYIHLT